MDDPKKGVSAVVVFCMHSNRPASRRIPGWQIGCIDSKWKWSLPWGVVCALLLTCVTSMFSPWLIYEIRRKVTYELVLKFADNATSSFSEATIIRIDDALKVEMGATVFDISFPELRENDRWWQTEPIWRLKVRDTIRKEFKKLSPAGIIVIRVDPQVQLETIAIVWTSIEAVSKATLYLDVTSTEQSGVD